jgi:hypothetical protein
MTPRAGNAGSVPLVQRLIGARLGRHTADTLLGWYARHRVGRLNYRLAARVQQETLLALVRHARDTRFGRDHDFARVRTLADYQARVPLREYEAYWKDFWQPAFPNLQGVSWPDPIPYLALSSGTTSGSTKYIPVSTAMLASNRKGALTTLSLFLAAYPRTPLFTGRAFFLGGSSDLTVLAPDIRAGDLSGIAAREVSSVLRPFTYPPLELALLKDWDRKLTLLAEQSAPLPITILGGIPSWLLMLFEHLKRVTGQERIADIWPTLRLLIHGGTKFDPYRALFRREIGSDAVHFVETYPCSEGYVATEDPRHGLLRLVPDHGIFFEFVPVEELGKDRPARHTVADLEPGVQYAVILTTCAGLWSYVLGDTICFESREPPLLRFTGRTRYFLSAFGEHLISEEVEHSVAAAAEATGAAVADFHVGPVFPDQAAMLGRHRYLMEFVQPPAQLDVFVARLDEELCRLNEDYRAHRGPGANMGPPEIWPMPRGAFAEWLRQRGHLGGQHKVPRMDNSGKLTEDISRWLRQTTPRDGFPAK